MRETERAGAIRAGKGEISKTKQQIEAPETEIGEMESRIQPGGSYEKRTEASKLPGSKLSGAGQAVCRLGKFMR